MDTKRCDPKEVALKSFFLGPRAENARWIRNEVRQIFNSWFRWRRHLFPGDGRAITDKDLSSPLFTARRKRLRRHLHHLVRLFEKEVPKFSPRYIGHMVSEISLPALLGHILTLLHNPNNCSSETSKVGAILEKEAISSLLKMVGMNPKKGQGHFTSGGTVANIEALWRARYRLDHWLAMGGFLRDKHGSKISLFQAAHQGWNRFNRARKRFPVKETLLRRYSFVATSPWRVQRLYEEIFRCVFPGPVVLIPRNKHYSWPKAVSLLGFGEEAFWEVELDENGKLSLTDLKARIEEARRNNRPIAMVVSVAGTTEMGEIDPVNHVQDLLDQYQKREGIHIWHHVDAAYGGFFCSLSGGKGAGGRFDGPLLDALKAIRRADSVTLDPHKLGYVPYSCGAILLKDAEHDRTSLFTAPYISFQKGKDQWTRTLEGSRSAAGAVATWLTARCIGFNREGYGRILERTIESKKKLEATIRNRLPGIRILPGCDTNILCFCMVRKGEPLSRTNRRSFQIYREISGKDGFYVSKTALGIQNYRKLLDRFFTSWSPVIDQDHLLLLRVVLMNPFFSSRETRIDYIDLFVRRLERIIRHGHPSQQL